MINLVNEWLSTTPVECKTPVREKIADLFRGEKSQAVQPAQPPTSIETISSSCDWSFGLETSSSLTVPIMD